MLREPLRIETSDSVNLEAELVTPEEPRFAAVLTHPHPRHGGNMTSMVPGELIKALPEAGAATLRFNFRGMGTSTGTFTDGPGERIDTFAAIETLYELVEGLPLFLCGSSFGADTALTVDDERIDGWCAMAPPLRDERWADMATVASTSRPKLLVVAERDSIRAPESVRQVTEGWHETRITMIPGADHFFVGRIEKVIRACTDFVTSGGVD